jgi:rhodanese-related sulfurtransferase
MAERQTIGGLLEASRARIDRVSPAAAASEVAAGALLIDTRCAELRQRDGVVPGSIHIPLSVLFWRLDPTSGSKDPAVADPDRRIILLCAHGYSSSIAAATLHDLGFGRIADVDGGFEAWAQDGMPVERA